MGVKILSGVNVFREIGNRKEEGTVITQSAHTFMYVDEKDISLGRKNLMIVRDSSKEGIYEKETPLNSIIKGKNGLSFVSNFEEFGEIALMCPECYNLFMVGVDNRIKCVNTVDTGIDREGTSYIDGSQPYSVTYTDYHVYKTHILGCMFRHIV